MLSSGGVALDQKRANDVTSIYVRVQASAPVILSEAKDPFCAEAKS